MHPNLTNVNNADTRRLRSITSDNFSLIDSDSPVSSYDVLLQSDIALTFGSTIGIEAVYWGIPSVIAGPAMYDHLGGVYIPQSHSELIDLLCKDLVPQDKIGAKKFGYHMRTFGVPFRIWKALDFHNGVYRGIRFGDSLVNSSNILLRAGMRFGPQSIPVRALLTAYPFLNPVITKAKKVATVPRRGVRKLLKIFNRF
jgi:hypothetical protein